MQQVTHIHMLKVAREHAEQSFFLLHSVLLHTMLTCTNIFCAIMGVITLQLNVLCKYNMGLLGLYGLAIINFVLRKIFCAFVKQKL